MLNSKFLIYNFFFVWLMQSHCSAMLNNLSQSVFCAATSSIVFKLGQFSSGNVQNLSLVLASAAPPVVGSLFNLFHPKIEEDKVKKQSSYFKQSFIFDLILAVLNYSFFSDEFFNEQLFKKINIIKLIAIPTLRFCYLVAVNQKEVAVNEKEVEASRLNGEIASLEQEKKDGEERKKLLLDENNSLKFNNNLSSNKINRLEGQINMLQVEKKEIKEEKTKMESEIESLTSEINFWNNEKSNWQKNIKNLEEVVLQKDGTNISLQKEKDNLKIKLNEASAKNKELKEQCENLKKEKEKISHELPAMKVESGVMNSMENWPSLSLIKIID